MRGLPRGHARRSGLVRGGDGRRVGADVGDMVREFGASCSCSFCSLCSASFFLPSPSSLRLLLARRLPWSSSDCMLSLSSGAADERGLGPDGVVVGVSTALI